MIVMAAQAEDGDARDSFKQSDVGDLDQDGLPEFLDGWGQPIKYLRWPAGFQYSDLQIVGRIQNPTGGSMMPVTGSGTGLSPTAGAYSGGCIIVMELEDTQSTPPQPVVFDTTKTARVTGYQMSPAQAGQMPMGTFSVPSNAPSLNGTEAVILAPDPFDPRGVLAAGTAAAAPSFATYPLIFSAGPNKCFGILIDPIDSNRKGLSYADTAGDPSTTPPRLPVNLNPFYIGTEDIMPQFTGLVGTARNDSAEANYVPNAWLDNIHNHQLGNR
jgi:hypothetical protein